MAALAHDRVAAGRRRGPGGRRCPEPALDAPPCPRRVGPVPEVGEGGWRAPLALVVVVALMAAGGALAGAVADVAGVAGGHLPAVESPSGSSATPAPAASSSVATLGPRAVHVVQPGETWWSIAVARGGEADIRVRVAALEEANGGRPLRAGDRLVLPEWE